MSKRVAPPPPYTSNTPHPAPSAPHDDGKGSDTKGIDWSLNRPGVHPTAPPRHAESPNSKTSDWSLNNSTPGSSSTTPKYSGPRDAAPTYPGPGISAPTYPGQNNYISPSVNTANPPVSAYAAWKEKFSRVYPDSKMFRDDPSIIRVEIPKNRAFPVVGHATCPDCFNNGPHEAAEVKKRVNFLFSKTIRAQKCQSCSKLSYFIQTNEEVSDVVFSSDRPPPYLNRPSPLLTQGAAPSTAKVISGHGWYDQENESGHGWKPSGESGHGWST